MFSIVFGSVERGILLTVLSDYCVLQIVVNKTFFLQAAVETKMDTTGLQEE